MDRTPEGRRAVRVVLRDPFDSKSLVDYTGPVDTSFPVLQSVEFPYDVRNLNVELHLLEDIPSNIEKRLARIEEFIEKLEPLLDLGMQYLNGSKVERAKMMVRKTVGR